MVVPHLFVNDLEQSILFYCELLGFHVEWLDETDRAQQAMLRLHDTALLFSKVEENRPTLSGEIYFYVDEVDELYEEIKDDVYVVCPPTDVDGNRIFKFRDCNGYNLVFATIETEEKADSHSQENEWDTFLEFGENWLSGDDGNENFDPWAENWN